MRAGWILAATLAGGCAASPRMARLQPCVFELKDVVHERSEDEFTVRFRLQFRVINPNPYAVRLDSFRASAQVEGMSLGLVYLPQALYVPAGGTEIMKIPMDVGTHAVPGALGAVRNPKSTFRFGGSMLLAGIDPGGKSGEPAVSSEFPVEIQGPSTPGPSAP